MIYFSLTGDIRDLDCETGLLMGKWIFLRVGPVKILFLMVDRSAKEFGWCWTRCTMSLVGGPGGGRPRSPGLAGVQNPIWILKKSESMIGRRGDLR